MANTIPKNIRFEQYAQPALQDGNYSITVTQNITITQNVDSVSKKSTPSAYTNESRFAVLGPRFSLDPNDLISMFPPPFSLGEFSNVLPHVVLSRTSLPWGRSPGVKDAANDAPWLGVILFDEGDPAPAIQEKTLLDLLPTTEQAGPNSWGLLPPDTYFPKFPLDPKTQYPELDFGETWLDKCLVLDLPVELFNQVMPTADDLGWLAHVREIELINKSETYLRRLCTSPADLNPIGQVAEVVGNRFALPGKKSVAHLVCLENFGPVLPGASGQSNLDAQIKTVRLVSLKNWTFSAVSQDYTFAGLLLNVNRPGGVFTQNTLQIPFTDGKGGPGDAIVANAFNMGFAAFDHTTRLGDQTVSWFHGPFVPYNLQTTVPFPGNFADQFTRYNPDSGMFDVAYSAAWQLGRLLGLQSSNYATTLYNWKRGVTEDVIQSIEQKFLNLSYSEMIALLHQTLSNYVDPLSRTAISETEAIVTKPVRSTNEPAGAAQSAPERGLVRYLLGLLSKFLKWIARLLGLTLPPDSVPDPVVVPTTIIKPNRLVAIRDAMAKPATINSILAENGAPDVPFAVTNFLARLRLLYGIPFNYLVPDERMLPSESMRFFYVDNAWVDCMLEGALSIGNATSSDAALSQAMAPFIHASVNAGARNIRRSVLKMPLLANTPITPITNPTGFLLRSQVVTGWPGMEVFGYDSAGQKLDFLRLEQVGPGVLLCIFDGVVQKVEIHEHPEALHFGVDEDVNDPSPAKFTKSFRYISAVDGNQPGAPVPINIAPPLSIPNYTRQPISAVLRANELAAALQTELEKKDIYAEAFTAAEFALEMIEGVQQVTFTFAAG